MSLDMNDSPEFAPDNRNPLDLGHFTLGFVGFVSAAAGIVLVSPCIAVTGIILFLWSAAYFIAQPEE